MIATVLATLVLSLQPDAEVRLLNPNDVAAEVMLTCDDGPRTLRLHARDLADIRGCTSFEALLPVVALETTFDGDRDWQHAVDANAECGTTAMAVPLFACKAGVATAYVAPVDGASYEWTVQGATILEGDDTHRVLLQLIDAKTASLTCIIRTSDCTRTATGAIAVREPIVVKEFGVPANANSGQPATITWSYETGHEPVTQLLSGDALGDPVTLGAAARSYTFTPRGTGMRSVELRASYANQIVLGGGPRTRRRAVGGAGASASDCPSARASAKMDVRGCGAAEPWITAPEDVGAGETFEALVDVQDGQKVQWSVENGSIPSVSPFGERVQVKAGATGVVKLTARIERTPGCAASAAVSIPIILPANQCAVVPSAIVTLGSRTCDRANVSATFTGTPPFAGEWSDGTPFRTTRNVATHEFRKAGTYGITRFRDASCFGTATTAEVVQMRPTAQLDSSGSCGTNRLVATFTGVPPFTGQWSDGQSFNTSSNQLERTVSGGGKWFIRVSDAVCSELATSRTVEVLGPPRATVFGGGLCQISPGQGLSVGTVVSGGNPPYVVEWAHGAITTSGDPQLWQSLPATTNPVTEYEVKRVTAGACEAEVIFPRVRIYYRERAVIAPRDRHNVLCVDQRHVARLSVPPSPGAKLEWSVDRVGVIVKGRNDPEMTFSASVPGWTKVSLKTTYPDNVCNTETTSNDEWYFSKPVWIDNLRFEPATIKRGGTARLTYDHNNLPTSSAWTIQQDRARDWNWTYHTYTDTIGPGTFTVTMVWTDPCSGDYPETATLTITD